MLNLIHNSESDAAHQPGKEPVRRLMFASRSRVTEAVFTTMLGTRADAMRHNLADNVYVALLIQSGWFMEWIEGPETGVQALLTRVLADFRHHSAHVLHESDGARRLTEPWSMAMVQTHESEADFGNRVLALHEEHCQGHRHEPTAVWRRLSTPQTHPGAADQAIEWNFQRVMVVAALGTDAFNMVRWLGETHAADVVHRRFVGSSEQYGDVATDYVDLPTGIVVRRVIAMSQNGLKIGLTRAFMSDYSHVIVLLSGIPGRDHSLLERLLSACAELTHRPTLVGVGPTADHHVSLRQLARSHDQVYVDCEIADETGLEARWAAAQRVLDQELTGSEMGTVRVA
jgi:hypothetical protein